MSSKYFLKHIYNFERISYLYNYLLSEVVENTNDEAATIPTLSKAEIVKRLRERGHPILLFGETLTDACERLKQIDMDAPDTAQSQASGLTNDFK